MAKEDYTMEERQEILKDLMKPLTKSLLMKSS